MTTTSSQNTAFAAAQLQEVMLAFDPVVPTAESEAMRICREALVNQTVVFSHGGLRRPQIPKRFQKRLVEILTAIAPPLSADEWKVGVREHSYGGDRAGAYVVLYGREGFADSEYQYRNF